MMDDISRKCYVRGAFYNNNENLHFPPFDFLKEMAALLQQPKIPKSQVKKKRSSARHLWGQFFYSDLLARVDTNSSKL